jgi:hypothetical protein
MKESKSCLKVIIMFLFLTSCSAPIAAQIQEVAKVAPETLDFDISIFFTGNIQGNIEPCG